MSEGPTSSGASSQELINLLRAEGMTWATMGAHLGRDPKLLQYIARGDKPGHNLTQSLTELVRTGEVLTPPPRRRNRRGRIVRVRSTEGTITPSEPHRRPHRPPTGPPPEPRARPEHARHSPQYYVHQLLRRGLTVGQIAERIGAHPSTVRKIDRGTSSGDRWTDALLRTTRATRRRQVRSTEQPEVARVREPGAAEETRELHATNERTGREFHRWDLDQNRREENSNRVMDTLRRAGASLQRFHGTVWVQVAGRADPMAISLGSKGGYDARRAAQAAEQDGGAFEWLRTQVEGRYPELDPGGDWTVVGMDLHVW